MHSCYASSSVIKKTTFVFIFKKMIETLILSIVQGITEFLPISSSSHLILISKFTNFQQQSLSIDISLHIGSFIAILTYFRRDIINFTKNKELFFKILVSSIPIIFVGFFLLKTNLIEELRNIKVIAWTTIIFALLLYSSDKFKLVNNIEKNFNFKSALLIGLIQVVSLIPGVSRSGVTITAARFLNFKRVDSAKISFLLSIPTLGAVSIYGLSNIFSSDINFSILNVSAIIFAFFFSLVTIKYFIQYIRKFSLNLFVYYRIFLGIIIIYFAYLQN